MSSARQPSRNLIPIDILSSTYDKRAPGYDLELGEFHKRFAEDFAKWAKEALPAERTAMKTLDLCCGTGLVSMAVLDQFGNDSVMDCVDISAVSLKIAENKGKSRGATNVRFFERSVTELEALPLEKGSYSLITCCSAFVLLHGDLTEILRTWSTYLEPGGLLVVDVPVPRLKSFQVAITDAAKKYGAPGASRYWIEDEASLERVVNDSGLVVKRVFTTDNYNVTKGQLNSAAEKWDAHTQNAIIGIDKLTPENQAAAKEEFLRIVESYSVNGEWQNETKLYVGIAAKPQ